MAYAFSERSLSRCTHVDPRLMAVARLAIAASPVDFGMTEEQSRTVAQQAQKVRDGFSKTMDSKHKIQPDGHSKALDLVPWVDGRFQWGDGQWRVRKASGEIIHPFHEIALAMRAAAMDLKYPVRWGAVWDRRLDELPGDLAGMMAAVEAYKVRHPGADFLDGPHFELVS
jgi:peptidoglycan L-alanyl-D-glutamate endopeptidase CwlK